MPNIVYNRLAVTGSPKAVKGFVTGVRAHTADGDSTVLDLETLIPVPENLSEDDWLDWFDEHWGTRNGVISPTLEGSAASGCVIYFFETAWTSPDPWIVRASKEYPHVELVHESVDEFGVSAERRRLQGGKTIAFDELEPALVEWAPLEDEAEREGTSLRVRDIEIMTFSELRDLIRGLEPDRPTDGVLQAWRRGESLEPEDLYRCLAIEGVMNALTPRAEQLIQKALARIEHSFGAELD